MHKWYVAPPSGYHGQPSDWVDVERSPVGPPGSDAAAMSEKLSYGPPGRQTGFVAGPPSSSNR